MVKPKVFKVPVEIPVSRIVDLFVSACEGGSNYWCKELTPASDKGDPYEAMLAGFTIIDGEQGKTIKVTPAKIKKAVDLFVSGGDERSYGAEGWSVQHFADLINENDDSTTADVFLQLCTFGRVIYG